MPGPGSGGRGRGLRLTVRLLLFNLLVVFLPLAGLAAFGLHERQLLEAQERSMVQQGRILAAALETGGAVDAAAAGRLLAALGRRSEARLRVVDAEGRLLADSSRLGARRARGAAEEKVVAADRRGLFYALGALPFSAWARLSGAPGVLGAEPLTTDAGRLSGPEVADALAGRYGAATRFAAGPERGLVLSSAIPVRVDGRVAGAVVVSQSTARILGHLYEIRLRTFVVFLASLAAAVVLSIYLAGTIARPLRALGAEARALVDGRGRLRGRFRGSARADEIGALARALEELTRRLEARQAATEAMAAEVGHELKNPLASIRAASELLASAESAEDRRRFASVVEQEVARMERLLSGVREMARLDAPEPDVERRPVDLEPLARALVDAQGLRDERGVGFRLAVEGAPVAVLGAPDRFAALLESLLDNAAGFSPPGGRVDVVLARRDGRVRLEVADRGPGVPAEHRDRIFERFFTWRPDEPGRDHSGLGLAIARSIAEAHGGGVEVTPREGGGSRFVVDLPAA
jgi:two-component system sensor histidine kinase ChvG